ncbi:hypothetical protein NW762_009475 [Fusarium torreyae]|uniref:Uncharacterized protein n=1 Tax=Fusarium torreyae TaxID=1237075 RepID=A0A9W8VEH3_9HYPO|nr:hypothetical protein NW762_009475 [Fusarium torreyae]
MDEQYMCLDLFRLEHDIEAQGNKDPATMEDVKRFFDKSSRKRDNPDGTLRQRDFYDTSIPAGTLKRTIAAANPNGQVAKSTVFLDVELNSERWELKWTWRDANGGPVDLEDVNIYDSNPGKAINNALMNYDASETARINSYNEGRIIATVHRRIVRFVAAGTAREARIHSGDRGPQMEPLHLATDCLDKVTDMYIQAREERRRQDE